jgi:acyl-CoA reductase-like NAD-dependent aldehyde dehydrogenase
MVDTLTGPLATYGLSETTKRFLDGTVFGHVIGGKVVQSTSAETVDVFDPSSGRLIGQGARGSIEDVNMAVALATKTFDDGDWRDLAPMQKERRLHRLADLIGEHASVIAELDTLDAGIQKGFTDFYMNLAVDMIHYFAGWPSKLRGSIPSVDKDVAVYIQREPIGVCAVVVPWNAPAMAALSGVPALAAGNSVIVKPAEQTPMSAVLIGQLFAEAGIPAGALAIVQGDGRTGQALVEHPDVAKISFTGSADTGRRIQAAAAPRLKKVTLELGGKSPNIVFADADLALAAAGAQSGVWNNSGQVCTAGTRVLVERSIHDEFVSAMVEGSKDLRLGGAFDPATQMGPLISAEQLARVEGYVENGKSQGAQVALGGSRVDADGYFFNPTIFTDVRNEMRIAQEEIFGPVMVVVPFDSEAEAYAIANDTEFGLSSGVWTNDLSRAHRASRAIKAGTVWVNTYQEVSCNVPYGGFKQSGYGRNLGSESIEDYTQHKSVWMRFGR